MVLSHFRWGLTWRLLSLLANGVLVIWLGYQRAYPMAGLCAVVWLFQLYNLFNYVDGTNRKLTRFLESIKYADFTSGFAGDDRAGASFRELNQALTEVMDAFRQTRAEKEEHWQYLHTVVQHISVGLLSYDGEGRIELLNNTARRFLTAPTLRNLSELQTSQPDLYQTIVQLPPGRNTLFRPSTELQLSISATELRLRERTHRIIALQNIQSELQEKEIEAWQNLSKVLRHEIMNSVTPISSLVSTLNDIMVHDLRPQNADFVLEGETVADLREGLATIESRSKGLINFINTYRTFTNIPAPNLERLAVKTLADRLRTLMLPDLREANVSFVYEEETSGLELFADAEQLEMVLINLIKNAAEALVDTPEPRIWLRARESYDHHVLLEVEDNGPGIIPEALDNIFIPFFTTKAEGSGIGLSWSRQIMQMHKGSLTVQSRPGRTVFTLRF